MSSNLIGKARLLKKQERYEEALEFYKKVKEKNPFNSKADTEIGKLLYIIGDYEGAVYSYLNCATNFLLNNSNYIEGIYDYYISTLKSFYKSEKGIFDIISRNYDNELIICAMDFKTCFHLGHAIEGYDEKYIKMLLGKNIPPFNKEYYSLMGFKRILSEKEFILNIRDELIIKIMEDIKNRVRK